MEYRVPNQRGLELDVLVTGEPTGITVLCVHGFGTGKHENGDLLRDVATELRETAQVVQFDFSGYGQSQGHDVDASIETMTADVNAMVAWIKAQFPGRAMILAHSMGCFAVANAAPVGIERSIFSGIPRPNTDESIQALQRRLLQRGGTLNVDGVSIYPRKDGQRQRLGRQYWSSLAALDPLGLVQSYARTTELTIIKPLEDEIIGGSEITSAYRRLPGVTMVELHGDHGFTKPKDRRAYLRKVHELIAERG